MKPSLITLLLSLFLASCGNNQHENQNSTQKPEIEGTWKLISGTLIEKGDTTITDYTKNLSFIKIINKSHFAFLKHDLSKGKDTTATYDSGGGTYTLKGNNYTEILEYCSAREWEGNTFNFTVSFKNDTLTQSGVEVVKSASVNRINIEKYVRLN